MVRFVKLVRENVDMIPFLSVVAAVYAIIGGGIGVVLLEEDPWLAVAAWTLGIGSGLLLFGGIPLYLQFRAGREDAREASES
jgi:hypothetical protein